MLKRFSKALIIHYFPTIRNAPRTAIGSSSPWCAEHAARILDFHGRHVVKRADGVAGYLQTVIRFLHASSPEFCGFAAGTRTAGSVRIRTVLFGRMEGDRSTGGGRGTGKRRLDLGGREVAPLAGLEVVREA